MSKQKQTKSLPQCECGCGAETKGGRFLPGHDAKLKKSLIESALGGSKRAEAKLEGLGWTKFLEAKREKQSAAKPEKKASAKPERKAKKGKAAAATDRPEAEQPAGSESPTTGPAPAAPRRGRPRKVRPEEETPPATTEADEPTAPQ